MAEHSFSLLPFDPSGSPAIVICGRILRQDNRIDLRYVLSGDLNNVLLPPPAAQPGRRHELWQATCFEFFLGRKGEPSYWEFNLSPSGDWNVYRIDAYRRIGFREESRVLRLQSRTQKKDGTFTLTASVDLSPIFLVDDILEAGMTAIIQTSEGMETYWALTHAGPQADFHLRRSFIVVLAGQTHPLNQPSPGD